MTSNDYKTAVVKATPYQLDITQTTQASKVLLKHLSKSQKQLLTADPKPNLLASEVDENTAGDDREPIWLILTTKKHIVDQKRLKPYKIKIPHSLNASPTNTICLITADPQNIYTDLIASSAFPAQLRSRMTRTISLAHLKKNYGSFESRRALLATHDIFLADDRVILYLPKTLGSVFYKGGTKRPIPVGISESRERVDGKRVKLDPANGKPSKDKIEGGRGAGTPQAVASEIEKALACAIVHLAPGTSTAIKVGLSGMTPAQITENITAVVDGMIEKKMISNGWRNVRSIHIKGPNTMSFPVWLASELWVDESDILAEKKTFGKKGKTSLLGSQKDETKRIEGAEGGIGKKRKADETGKPKPAKHVMKKRKMDQQLAEELASRKQSLKKQKAEALAQAV